MTKMMQRQLISCKQYTVMKRYLSDCKVDDQTSDMLNLIVMIEKLLDAVIPTSNCDQASSLSFLSVLCPCLVVACNLAFFIFPLDPRRCYRWGLLLLLSDF
jgi:hypothetical protein